MHDLELRGLPIFHPAAALAVYGLYAVIPTAKIFYVPDVGRGFFPVLRSDFNSLDELSAYLSDKNTWGTHIPHQVLNHRQYLLSHFNAIKSQHIAFAAGLGTDSKLRKKKQEITLSRTPFYCIDFSSWKFGEQFEKVLNLLDVGHTKATLNKFPWQKIEGQNFGFFYESILEKVNKKMELSKQLTGSKQVKEPDSSTTTIPVLCALGVASWKVLPCFTQGRDTLTPGWTRCEYGLHFICPVFTKPSTLNEAVSWLCNSTLAYYAQNKQAWRKLGIAAVWQTRLKRYPKGGGYLMESSRL